MARAKDFAPRWPEGKRIPHHHIEFGSAEHAALLGIDNEDARADVDPEQLSKLERQLEHAPVIACPEDRKIPPTRRYYDVDEPIMDGWAIRGRR